LETNLAYAENTTVSIERSVSEIVALVKKNGANRIMQVEEPGYIGISFFLNDRLLRFKVNLPGIETIKQYSGNGRYLNEGQRKARLEQRHMQRARALLLVIKAKMESVESGVETFEEAFLANVVMPNGMTIAEMTVPRIAQAYESGETPPLLLTSGATVQ
jgi:hypothetical protein